jgi:hypothetical protein
VRHPEIGFHHYTGLSDDRSALVPLEGRVGSADPTRPGAPRHLRLDPRATGRAAMVAAWAMPGTPRRRERRAEKDARRAVEARSRSTPAPS